MASGSPKKNTRGRTVPRRVGRTVEGIDYVHTHSCPSCWAVVETLGAAYPQLICPKCKMQLVVKSTKVETK